MRSTNPRVTQALEDHVDKQPNFNRGKRPRRGWQDGKPRYIISSKVFAKQTPHNTKQGEIFQPYYDVHPWIFEALAKQTEKRFIPNPDKPRLLDYIDNKLVRLEDSPTPYYRKGDIIWMSLKVGFAVGLDSWGTEVMPIEFIRVGTLPDSMMDKRTDSSMYPSLPDDFNQLITGSTIVPLEGTCSLLVIS